MTQTPGTPPGDYVNRYSPEEIDFANRLSRAVRPGEYHGAEMAGTAANIAGYLLPAGWIARLLRAGGQPGTPTAIPPPPTVAGGSVAPGSPLGPAPQPGPAPQRPPAPEPEGFPKVVEDLRTQGRDPSTQGVGKRERAYGRYLDEPTDVSQDIKPWMSQRALQRLIDALKK